MAEFVKIYGLQGEFRAPRSDLLRIDYFRAMLTNNPPHLFLPFPDPIISEILGVIFHANDWKVSSDPNVTLGLQYCGLTECPAPNENVFSLGQGGIFIPENQTVISVRLKSVSLAEMWIKIDNKSIFNYHFASDKTKLSDVLSAGDDQFIYLSSSILKIINDQPGGKLLEIFQYHFGQQITGPITIAFSPQDK